ncbi:transglutaminase family protein [Marinobacter sp. chi1]|uniref:Transglutaminase family protein n=1 Tax=Marinobacter suaedae TaxID=3057675 RepID=A0ABT8VZZ4_9GAMM|nr:transglutaminase family protein [Marinobacter sp. chi1]MDO3721576.1 transglutaminase family protein [Marinobacter sp. chi1]
MKLTIHHETRYTYESPIEDSIQYIRLTPRTTPQQRIHDWKLRTPGETSQMVDGFGNLVTVMTLTDAAPEITLVAEGVVDLTGKPLTRDDSPFPPQVFLRQTDLTDADEALKAFANEYSANKRSLVKLMTHLREHISFMPGATTVTHTAREAFELGAGVCQDHTHIFIACCRHIGVPARYVSGYIHSADDDHVATHAWAEAWIGSNWHTFDVVNTLNVAESHIKLAVGLDYQDAAPVRGVRTGGGTEQMETIARVIRASSQ